MGGREQPTVFWASQGRRYHASVACTGVVSGTRYWPMEHGTADDAKARDLTPCGRCKPFGLGSVSHLAERTTDQA